MAGKKKQIFTAEDVLDMLANDSGTTVCPVESSSDEDDLLTTEWDPDNSDPDYEITFSESDDDDYEPPGLSTTASTYQKVVKDHSSRRSEQSSSALPRPTQTQPGLSKSDPMYQTDVKGNSSSAKQSSSALATQKTHPGLSTPTSLPQTSSEETPSKRMGKAAQKSLHTKHGRGATAVSAESEEEESWHNKEEEDNKPDPLKFMPGRTPGPTFDTSASWSPLSMFQLFFSTSVVHTLIENTNANAAKRLEAGKKFVWRPLDVRDFYIFLAIIIFSGLVTVHHRADYWRKKWPYNFPFPNEKISRNRFEAILWSLHLSNPDEDEENERKKNSADYDRLFKIKPLYNEIVTACMSHFHPYQNISIDERMVASKARHSMKQYMKDKPTKWGFKLFVLADSSNGYTWNFFVDTGKRMSTTGHGLSYSSVMELLPFSLLGRGYKLYVDNFYTSPILFQDLFSKHIGCCGTIRRNRIGFSKTAQNGLPEKAERGDLRWLRKGSLLFVKWMDTREVNMCSTVHEAFSGQTIKRRVKTAGVWQTKNIPVPDAVTDYNHNMGGVDLSDALIGYYSVHHKSVKWYKTFFYHFVDIAVVNSFILHKELCKVSATKNLSHKVFREQLAEEMVRFADSSDPSPLPPPAPSTCMPLYYGGDATQSRRYCRRCQDAGIPRMKTPVYCRKCQVPLCLTSKKNCFQLWHDGQ